jgi:hypothetical protein
MRRFDWTTDRRYEIGRKDTGEKRDAMVEEYLDKLPPGTQRDIVTLFTFAPAELARTPTAFRDFMLNTEFDDPSSTKV